MASVNTTMDVNQYEDIEINNEETVPHHNHSDDQIDEPNQLQEFAVNLSKDYAEYFNVDTSKETKICDDSIEDLLTHLEEFCGIIDMIRNDNTQCLDEMLKTVHEKSLMMEEVYVKIDKLHEYVNVVRQNVSLMEEEMNRAESLFANSRVKKFFKSIISTNKLQSTVAQRPKYTPPEIFNTDDYIQTQFRVMRNETENVCVANDNVEIPLESPSVEPKE